MADVSAAALPEPLDLLITNAVILTLDRDRRILERGHLGVRDKHIALVEPGDPAAASLARRTIDAHGGIVHPGFIDAHAHVGWGVARGFIPESFSEDQIFNQFDTPMLAAVTDEDEHVGTQLSCLEMVLNGTTCFADTGSALRDLAPSMEAVEHVGIRGMTSLLHGDALEHVPELHLPTDACLKRIEDGIAAYPLGSARAWACAGLVGMETSSDALVHGSAEVAARAGVPLNMHKSFTEQEASARRSRLGGREPMQGFAELGVLRPNLTLVHMNAVTELELELLAETGPSVVHCPTASMLYGIGASRFGRHPEMLAAGIALALGTDATMWQNAWDLSRSIYLAATLHKEARQTRPAISAAAALEMATRHGAAAVGRGAELGSLEPGKLADLVIHHIRRPESHPALDPVGSLVFSTGARSVRTVVVGGEVVVEDGHSTRVDEDALFARVDQSARSLANRIGFTPTAGWPVVRSTA
jgi:cytosine/adenosine deaminase-related metal-dependent hydrolase